jgi:rubrerythrin
MFTITDICNIAVQIERNGEQTYLRASEKTKDPEFAQLFKDMAFEEKCHANWFESIRSSQPVVPEQKELEKMGRQLLQDMVSDQTFSLDLEKLAGAEDCDEILKQFIAFEEDTILFYDFLMNIIDDDATKSRLVDIIEEEKKHTVHIERMISSLKVQEGQ